MRRSGGLRSRLVAVLAVASAGLVVSASPAVAATLSSGHVDVFDIDVAGSSLTLTTKTYGAGADDNIDPGSTTFTVPSGVLTTVPSGSSYACLGAPGDPVYLLPQSETAAANLGALWAGWNTEWGSGGPSSVNLDLDQSASTVPSGGRFALYTTSLGAASYKLNTATNTGCAKPSFAINRGVHTHATWAFTQAGTYSLRMRVTATGYASSDWETYTFVVG
jgi:surface-anchored protein